MSSELGKRDMLPHAERLSIGFALCFFVELAFFSGAFGFGGTGDVAALIAFMTGQLAGTAGRVALRKAQGMLFAVGIAALVVSVAGGAILCTCSLAEGAMGLSSGTGMAVPAAGAFLLGGACAFVMYQLIEDDHNYHEAKRRGAIGRGALAGALLAAVVPFLMGAFPAIATALAVPLAGAISLSVPMEERYRMAGSAPVTQSGNLSNRALAAACSVLGCAAFVMSLGVTAAGMPAHAAGFVLAAGTAAYVLWLLGRGRLMQLSTVIVRSYPLALAALIVSTGALGFAGGWAVLAAAPAFVLLTLQSFVGLLTFADGFGLDGSTFVPKMRLRYVGATLAGTCLGCLGGLLPEVVPYVAAIAAVACACLIAALPLFDNTPLEDGLLYETPDRTEVVDNDTYRSRLEAKCAEIVDDCGLTAREAEVLTLLAKGMNVEAIAASLVVSKATVKTHKDHIFKKMDVHSQQEIIARVHDRSA